MSKLSKTPRTFHLGIHIAGTLKQSNEDLDGLLSIDDRVLSGDQVRTYLEKVKAEQPSLVLFTGDSCANQNERGECQGHPSS